MSWFSRTDNIRYEEFADLRERIDYLETRVRDLESSLRTPRNDCAHAAPKEEFLVFTGGIESEFQLVSVKQVLELVLEFLGVEIKHQRGVTLVKRRSK